MKTYTKSLMALCITAIIVLLSSCSRGSGCGTWSEIQYKKQYHSQTPKDNKNYANYNRYNR